MDIVSLRLGKKFGAIVKKDMRDFNYRTRTEYIRHAIRELHEKLRTEKAIAELARNKGFAKRMGIKEPTEGEYERAREEAAREYLKSLRAKQP